jgi:16S rRNA (cytosine1402-N4)-methyltransferase
VRAEVIDMQHVPVLAKEIKVLLNLKEGDNAIDGTFGFGGHTKLMLEAVGRRGSVLAIEQDKEIIAMSELKVGNLKIVNGNFKDIKRIADNEGFRKVKAILLDLGISRWHFLGSGRGFSFQDLNEPLIMNLDASSQRTAAQILNGESADELARIFLEYGDIKYFKARKLAESIAEYRKKRKIISVGDLLEITDKIIPRRGKLNPATKVFQALRIAVNNELENLKSAINDCTEILEKNGRLLIISFHSLEDRIVKNLYKEKFNNNEILLITKKPVIASREEVLNNPPSRSAKLRVMEKI